MKVLYITTMYPTPTCPQKGIFCHEQVKALLKLGVDVDVAAIIPIYDREVRQSSWDYEGVHIRYVRFFKLPGARDFHRAGYALFFSLFRAFHLKDYDVYHADAALPAGQAAMIASGKYRIPYIVHGHGLDVYLADSYKDQKNVGKIVAESRRVYQNASGIVGVSQKVLDRIEENKENQHVDYNGVDTTKFSPVNHQNERVRFISIGNLIQLKGHDLTIRAFKRLSDQYPGKAELEIIGRGPLEEELKALAASLDIDVQFTGYIPYDQVAEHLAKADIFVLPSWFEALGCVYLEAMACGLPVIGCWENGIDEVIHDGEDGFLVHNKNEDELLAVMERLMHKDIREQIGQQARNRVIDSFTWYNSALGCKNIYKKIMGK